MGELTHLRNYNCWIGRSPLEIRRSVIAAGGWARVFPTTVPQWANRVRNYFNVYPMELRLLDLLKGMRAASRVNRFGLHEDWKAAMALTDFVYEDRSGRLWYQMHTAGTVYHYEGQVDGKKEIKSAVYPQHHIPVFKLVSPDGTGGSLEVCVHNWQLARSNWHPVTRGTGTIGPVGKWVRLRTRIVLAPEYEGSYNYSETVVMGYSEHDRRDIKPHNAMTLPYLSTPAFHPIETRKFPAVDQHRRRIVAEDGLFLGLAGAG